MQLEEEGQIIQLKEWFYTVSLGTKVALGIFQPKVTLQFSSIF